jgi:ribose 5-phosphate isomerase A
MKEEPWIRGAKALAAQEAAKLVKDGTIIGLGTGSTAFFFIEALGKRCKEGLQIKAVSTSIASAARAQELGIPLIDIDEVVSIDLVVDGADAIDPQKQMIKGKGGALLREKIVASMSREMIVVIDATKQVSTLIGLEIPVEIVPFGHRATLHKLQTWGALGELRMTDAGQPYHTDNRNYILDIRFPSSARQPHEVDMMLRSLPGVVETGYFLALAGRVITGYEGGRIKIT